MALQTSFADGVNCAFLTGDLFNLYVWFEIMPVASFGLMILKADTTRIHASIKYVLLNQIFTLTLLLVIGLIYGGHRCAEPGRAPF